VVEACVKNGVDYVDICGETEFIETMYAEYNVAYVIDPRQWL
jgi:short subunit dehydrogenase-like uncharacterized protein